MIDGWWSCSTFSDGVGGTFAALAFRFYRKGVSRFLYQDLSTMFKIK